MIDYFKQLMLDFEDQSPKDRPANKESINVVKKTPIFISMSGKKQVGKDTAVELATAMLEKENKKVGVTAFAERLKGVAIDVLGIQRALVYGSNDDKETITHIMWDTMTDDIRLKYSTNFEEVLGFPYDAGYMYPEGHAKSIRQRKKLVMRCGPMTVREVLQVLGTDIFRVMFENNVWANAPFRRDWSGYDVVFITDCRFPNEKKVTEERNGVIIRLERDTGFVDNHPSETALDEEDFKIIFSNNGSLERLEEFMKNTLKDIGLINGTRK